MADLTLSDYVSTTLAMAQENRDNPDQNRKWRKADVVRAINKGRHRMLREVGLGLYRKQSIVNATTGDITPPVDFFSAGVARFQASASAKPVLLKVKTHKAMDVETPGWEEAATGTPNTLIVSLTTDGVRVVLHPPLASTVTNGLIWDYTARLDDLEDDSDECPIMNMFPEFQDNLVQAGALRHLYLLEGGEADDQYVKWNSIHASECADLRAHINMLFVGNGTLFGGVK